MVQGSGRPAPNRTPFAGRGGGGGWAAPPASMGKPAFPVQNRPKFSNEIAPASDPECWFYKDAMGAVSV